MSSDPATAAAGPANRRASLAFSGRLSLGANTIAAVASTTTNAAFGGHNPTKDVDDIVEMYSDMREHGYKGPTRTVRLPRVSSVGGGSIARAQGDDGRCVVAGRESLRIVRVVPPTGPTSYSSAASGGLEHVARSAVGRGGHRIDAGRNMWDGSGLKVDGGASAVTDVAWGYGSFSNKILTSARNGELVMWDINKSGSSKHERRTRDHMRAIHRLSYSRQVHYYCVTGSADCDMRVWDLRNLSQSRLKIHHPAPVRAVLFSPDVQNPLQAIAGLENGSLYRWDLRMGQRGQLDRVPVAHAGAILALDWCVPASQIVAGSSNSSKRPATGSAPAVAAADGTGDGAGGNGWIATGGMDRTVQVWDLRAGHIPLAPTYTLHPSFPVRTVRWRPEYECELAIVSHATAGTGSGSDGVESPPESVVPGVATKDISGTSVGGGTGDAVEIWDVRRGWIAKWRVNGSAAEGGVADAVWADSHALWASHASGAFSQLDVRQSATVVDAVPRNAMAFDPAGNVVFVADKPERWEVPYDDVDPELRPVVARQRGKLKALGDPAYRCETQDLGIVADTSAVHESTTFAALARGYSLDVANAGADRRPLCERNAQVALEAGHESAAQLWALVGALLMDIVPPSPPSPPLPTPLQPELLPGGTPALAHSLSAPAAFPHLQSPRPSVPPPTAGRGTPMRSVSTDPTLVAAAGRAKRSPGKKSVESMSASSSRGGAVPKPLTPVGSPSPMRSASALSSPSPTSVTSTRSPLLLRRESHSAARHFPRGFDPASRRPSLTPSGRSASPSESARGSLHHVGEGALSDGEGSEGDCGDGEEEQSEGEESDLRPLMSPLTSPHLHPRAVPPNPSPLSHVANPDDDDSSPSPASTESESEDAGSDSPPRMRHDRLRSKSGSASGGRSLSGSGSGSRTRRMVQARSRSSTLASLPAQSKLPMQTKALARNDSSSSVQTVIAAEPRLRERRTRKGLGGLDREETIRDMRHTSSRGSARMRRSRSQSRLGSDTVSVELRLDGSEIAMSESNGALEHKRSKALTGDRRRAIVEDERRMRELGWAALRDSLDDLANDGDVQTCASLAIVVRSELGISKNRAARFIESYLDKLSRLKLDAAAAYVRECAQGGSTHDAPAVHTVVYTSCGRCRKPIVQTTTNPSHGQPTGVSYCSECQ
ncbi:hypothetical protein PUNSTDRAFT_136739 [Punctularia strigosozonata HHB-11173 SS5]|uniref:uncharacterized protein n=1 Tax=Punctularia strigosozonata (strain HHB-11173) TaxID=741275 RepID=UPI000441709A|nr:uncharacterized protein PUNSTDRAFT_136739 [Punctularia strigosozonata HHB-11173 SS5]EIN06922.1 hypothetical protein PUNSTDRAFT_136739 [Punctularia strigosozonata HHB-11173 SS5]